MADTYNTSALSYPDLKAGDVDQLNNTTTTPQTNGNGPTLKDNVTNCKVRAICIAG